MTRLKKSLAVLLAFVMMFSSMSVAASAWTVDDDGHTTTFIVDFVRQTEDGSWVDANGRVKPGDKVKARVYIGTDYYTSQGDFALMFDSEFFKNEVLVNGVGTDLSTNTNYTANGKSGFSITSRGGWFEDAMDLNKDMDFIVEHFLDGDTTYFDTRDIISNNFKFGSGVPNEKMDISDWVVEYELTVQEDGKTRIIDSTGEAVVPPYNDGPSTFEYLLLINISKGEEGSTNRINLWPMYEWTVDPVINTTPSALTTTSTIKFDMGLSDSEGNWDETLYTQKKGIIGTGVSDESNPVADPARVGYRFMGWSDVFISDDRTVTDDIVNAFKKLGVAAGDLPAVGSKLTDDQLDMLCQLRVESVVGSGVYDKWEEASADETSLEVTAVEYDYEDKIVYAVWEKSENEPVRVFYTYEQYKMNLDGTYSDEPSYSQEMDSEADATVTMPDFPMEGFTLDKTLSDSSITVSSNNTSVLKAYYARNKYNAVYHYEDALGEQTDSVGAYYGAPVPGFQAGGTSGKPVKEGYDFVGWSTDPDTLVGVPATMPAGDLDLYPIFEKKTYTYYFDAVDGTFPTSGNKVDSVVYSYGDTPAEHEAPVKEGWSFVGWDNDIPATVSGDMTFEAMYNQNQYTVTFMDGDKVVDKVPVYHGDSILDEDVPEGYKTENSWKVGDTVVNFPYEVTGDITLNAIDSANVYDAVYYVDGVVYDTIPVEIDKVITAPEDDPEKAGYEFIGWDPAPEDSVMTEDGAAFDAVFEPLTITVTFDSNKGSEVNPVAQKFGTQIEKLPETTRDGYEFLGWFTEDGTKVGEPYNMPTEDTTLTAQWEAEEHTIKFVDEDGTTPVHPEIVAKTDSEITDPGEPSKKGYDFLGWLDSKGNAATVPETMPADDVVLKASWEKLSFDLTLDANDGAFKDGAETKSDKIPYGDALSVEEPKRDGHEFLGWAKADDETNTVITLPETMPDEALNLKAVWKTNVHQVIFDANQGLFKDDEGKTSSSIVYNLEYGKEITVPATDAEHLYREGYTFAGWSPALPDQNLMPDKDMTFVAQWEKDAVGSVEYKVYAVVAIPGSTETITTEVKSGKAAPGTTVEVYKDSSEADIAYEYASLINLESNEPDYENANNKTSVTLTASGDNTLTVYFKLKDVTATFNAGEGAWESVDGEGNTVTETTKDVEGKYGDKITAPEEEPKLTGYTFGGWDPAVTGTFTNDVTYTAIWNIQKHNAIFNINGEEYAVVEYEYNQTISAPAYTVPEGYEFSGWVITPSTMGESDLTFNATLTPETYTLSYSFDKAPTGAVEPASVSGLTVGTETTVAKAPVINGYTFSGWSYNGTPYAEGSKFTMPASDVELTGSYTANTYDINFNTGYTATVPSQSAECGSTVTSLPALNRGEGYEFLGWFDNAGEKVTAPFTMGAEDMTLTAKWGYKVTYTYENEVDGAPALPSAETYEENASVKIAEKPELDGYTFEGWTINGKPAEDFTMGTAPVEITGKWVAVEPVATKTVTYVTGVDGLTVPSKTAEVGTTYTLPDLTGEREGYTFKGWDNNGVIYGVGSSFTIPATDVTLTAVWEEVEQPVETYTLTLNPNGGTLNGSTAVFEEDYEAGTLIPPIATPVRTGYRFVRWVDSKGSTANLPTEMPANDVSYTADWAELFTVTYENEDGTVYETMADVGAEGENIPAPTKGDPSKDGYTFIKWVDADTGADVTTFPAGDVTLKPVFEEIIPDTYTITYVYTDTKVPDGAPKVPDKVTSVEAGETITVADKPTLEGYTFNGWYYNDALTESFIMPEENVTIEGSWTVNEYEITLNANGGLFKDDEGQDAGYQFIEKVPYGSDLSDILPEEPTREGYTFNGWIDDNGDPVTIPATMPAYDIDAKADWKINSYTITFDSNGGSAVPSATYEYGADVTEPAEPTREGFEFVSWSPALPETMPANNLTVVAQWKALVKTYTLTLDANDGAFADGKETNTKEFAEGEALENLPEPTRDGYKFIGWDNLPEDGKMPAEDTTITAKWEKVEEPTPTHTITYYLAENTDPYDTGSYEEGAAIVNPADPEKTGATFIGWFDKDGNAIPTVMGTEDIVAYAKFELNSYKATFMVDGEVYESFELLYGEKLTAPADPESSDPNKIFSGWAPTVPGMMPAEDMTFVAQFTDKPSATDQYLATFVSDGKTISAEIYKAGDVIEVPEDPEKFGFVFTGWDPAVPAEMPAEDITFEAQWEIDKDFVTVVVGGTVVAGTVIATIAGINAALITGATIVGGIIVIVGTAALIKNTHTVTYIVDGEVYKTYKVVEGTKIPVPADPVKDGFKFEGWNPEVPEKMGEEDLVFEATWSEKSDDSDVDVSIPDTGSVAGGLAAFAVISGAAAAAYVITRKKKED